MGLEVVDMVEVVIVAVVVQEVVEVWEVATGEVEVWGGGLVTAEVEVEVEEEMLLWTKMLRLEAVIMMQICESFRLKCLT